MAPSPKRTRSVVKKEIEQKKSPTAKSSSKSAKSSPGKSDGLKKEDAESRSSARAKKSVSIAESLSSQVCQRDTNLEDYLLSSLNKKQRGNVSKDFKEKIERVGNAIKALTEARKEYVEADQKVYQLEETYGKTMKIQDIWQYQERAGLAAIMGRDPQAVMNAEHLFKDEERLMYNSAYPRPSSNLKHEEPETQSSSDNKPETTSSSSPAPSPRRSPPRTRTRARQESILRDIKKAHASRTSLKTSSILTEDEDD